MSESKKETGAAPMKNDEFRVREMILNLTVSKATYLENAIKLSPPEGPGQRLDLTTMSRLREASAVWIDAADLCDEFIKFLKRKDTENAIE